MTDSRTSAGQELAVGLKTMMATGSSKWRAGNESIQKKHKPAGAGLCGAPE